ncbi:Fanconi anemia core complex-associated protein 20 [Pangasianodon hypophthalmus]|uniref:Fanconi anemia core complex-associated protein 20 n=1 Tax=Pangasianodon hypophthalmus TaxID=310915 RepID=UPI002307F5F9|nr:Fanconi anemia core complex-associated protein 20 [Pangasianodon hypophthalmus]
MSKLKRRKTALEEIKSEQQFRIRDQTESLRIPDAALHRRAAGSPAGGGSSCWTSSDLSDVEKLWMKTLQALCPEVPARDSALCVPRLPQLSTKQEEECERRWCSLDEDVIPFPNPLAPDPLPCSAPFPSSPALQNRAGCVPVRRASSDSPGEGSERSGVSESDSEQDPNTAAAGKHGSGPGHSGPECEGEAGTLDYSEIKSGLDPEMDNEAGTSGRGLGSDGLRLECCPMCLMPFPARFSQMECDGHLAQCLSEMNADMMW